MSAFCVHHITQDDLWQATPWIYIWRKQKKASAPSFSEWRDGTAAAKKERTSATTFSASPPGGFCFFSFWFNRTHNSDFQADPEDAPDACSHPEMTLPTRMTPFIEHDLSPPTRVDAWALTACSPERRGEERRRGKRKEKKGSDAAKKKISRERWHSGRMGLVPKVELYLRLCNKIYGIKWPGRLGRRGFVKRVSGLDVS